jgi:hypothetical protein
MVERTLSDGSPMPPFELRLFSGPKKRSSLFLVQLPLPTRHVEQVDRPTTVVQWTGAVTARALEAAGGLRFPLPDESNGGRAEYTEEQAMRLIACDRLLGVLRPDDEAATTLQRLLKLPLPVLASYHGMLASEEPVAREGARSLALLLKHQRS